MKITSLLVLISFLCFGTTQAQSESIEGLWVVQLVKVGDQEMTPNARWIILNKDHSQASGNGWLQHSVGSWQLDKETSQLNIVTTNGIDDEFGPFTVEVQGNEMTWNRNEGGQAVNIYWERRDELPQTHGDELKGLWGLESSIGNGPYFDESKEEKPRDYIFFRWDGRFEIRTGKDHIHGVFNVHGHKVEVELIPYGSPMKRDFWEFAIDDQILTMTLLNSDSKVTRTFKRRKTFPN